MKKLLLLWVVWVIISIGWWALVQGPFSIFGEDLLTRGINTVLWQIIVVSSFVVLVIMSAVVLDRRPR